MTNSNDKNQMQNVKGSKNVNDNGQKTKLNNSNKSSNGLPTSNSCKSIAVVQNKAKTVSGPSPRNSHIAVSNSPIIAPNQHTTLLELTQRNSHDDFGNSSFLQRSIEISVVEEIKPAGHFSTDFEVYNKYTLKYIFTTSLV